MYPIQYVKAEPVFYENKDFNGTRTVDQMHIDFEKTKQTAKREWLSNYNCGDPTIMEQVNKKKWISMTTESAIDGIIEGWTLDTTHHNRYNNLLQS